MEKLKEQSGIYECKKRCDYCETDRAGYNAAVTAGVFLCKKWTDCQVKHHVHNCTRCGSKYSCGKSSCAKYVNTLGHYSAINNRTLYRTLQCDKCKVLW